MTKAAFMMSSRPMSSMAKGQLRCFQCRQPCALKEGSWHNKQNQQVFLCKICEKSSKNGQAS